MARPTVTIDGTDINDHVNFFVLPGFDPGVRQVTWRESRGAIVNRQTDINDTGLVEMSLPMRVHGSSEVDLKSALATLHQLLRDANGKTFVYGTTSYELGHCQDFSDPHDQPWHTSFRAMVTLRLVRKPWAVGTPTTALNAQAITAPCVVDLGTIAGDYETPLTLEIEANTTDFHSLYVGRLAPGSALTIADLKRECETGSWTGGTPGTANPAGSSGASSRYNGSAAEWSTAQYSDATLDAGAYLLIGRGLAENAADDSNVYIRRAHDDAILGTYKWDGNTTWQLAELDQNVQSGGLARLPNRIVRGAGASNLKVQLIPTGPGGAGRAAFLDYVAFMPVKWGFFRWHPSASATDLTKLRVGADGMVYQDDVVSFADFRGRPIEAVGPTKLLVLAETVSPTATCALKITVSYTPREAGA